MPNVDVGVSQVIGAIFMIAIFLAGIYGLYLLLRETHSIFVSYRTTDVDKARPLAEYLLANSIRCWFAEFRILLAGRENFEAVIKEAVTKSHNAIVITSPEYFESEHCRSELSQLLEHNKKIFEFRIQPYVIPATYAEEIAELAQKRFQGTKHPQPAKQLAKDCAGDLASLIQAPRLDYSGNVNEAAGFLRKNWASYSFVNHDELNELPTTRREYKYGRFSYSLDVAGWKEVSAGGLHIGVSHPKYGSNEEGPRFVNADPYRDPDLTKERDFSFNVVVGPELEGSVRPQQSTVNDRTCFNMLLQFASDYFGTEQHGIEGVHLCFVGGYSQFAATYWYEPGKRWLRKYSVILPVDGHPPLEFVFTFGIRGLRESNWHLFYTQWMDRVVKSLIVW